MDSHHEKICPSVSFGDGSNCSQISVSVSRFHKCFSRSEKPQTGEIQREANAGSQPRRSACHFGACQDADGQQICNPPQLVRIRCKSPVFQEIANWADNNPPSRPNFGRRPVLPFQIRCFVSCRIPFSLLGTSFAFNRGMPLCVENWCLSHNDPRPDGILTVLEKGM